MAARRSLGRSGERVAYAGRFFSSFYSHFDAASSGTLAQRAALALQQAQLDMGHGDGYRSSPKFWAAYSIISKE